MVRKMIELFDHDLVERAQRILGLAEHLRDRGFAGKPLIFFVQTQLSTNQGNQVFGVTSIEDRKVRLKVDSAAISPKQHISHRVECATTNPFAACADQFTGPFEHFLRRFSREGQKQDLGRINPRIDQIGDAIDQGARLAAACAGDDQRWSFTRGHSSNLLGIQCRRIVNGERGARPMVRRPFEHIGCDISIHAGSSRSSRAV